MSTSSKPLAADVEASDSIYDSKDDAYFGYYSLLSHQAQMLQDTVRTSVYQRAILSNSHDFQDKLVMDVGAGNGILSFFSAQAGARRVYAVEASNMVEYLRMVVRAARETEINQDELAAYDAMGAATPLEPSISGPRNVFLADKLVPVHSKVEDVKPEHLEGNTQVDTIVSECLGVLLVHERMCESFIDARDRFLKPGGSVFPSAGTICLAPFEDKTLWEDTANKARWWRNNNFYGVDVTPFAASAFREAFSSPVVGVFGPQCLLSVSSDYVIDFATISKADLQEFTIPVEWIFVQPAIVHGLGGWFDLHFNSQADTAQVTIPDSTMQDVSASASASMSASKLSSNAPSFEPAAPVKDASSTSASFMTTSPYATPTHWQQVRFLLPEPIAVNKGQKLVGTMHCKVNEQR